MLSSYMVLKANQAGEGFGAPPALMLFYL